MNIDWDDIARNAAGFPPAMLSELHYMADSISQFVIVFHDTEGKQHIWESTDSRAMSIAMLATAQAQLCNDANEGKV